MVNSVLGYSFLIHKMKIFATLASLYLLLSFIKRKHKNYALEKKLSERRKIAKKRRTEVEKQINEKNVVDHIFAKSAHTVLEELKQKKISALEVLEAFQNKAVRLTDEINCVTEFIPESKTWAQQLDHMSSSNSLLHGLPVSVKENINICGYDSTAGMEINVGVIQSEDSVIVKVLKIHGAIPFVRTNIPQTMLSYDCRNLIYGETLNPLDHSRSPGGSSGGEAAIISGGASFMGIGTDIGGSLRFPAAFCGIFSLKPTQGRISSMGVYSPGKGNIAIQGTLGPMAKDLDSLILLSRVMMSQEMIDLDITVPRMPFNQNELLRTSRLRVGYYTYDGVIQCQPGMVRAVMEAKQALENQGHEVILFDITKELGECFKYGDYYVSLMSADRAENLMKLLSNDVPAKALRLFFLGFMFPGWFLKFLSSILSKKDSLVSTVLRASSGFRSIYEYQERLRRFQLWREEFAKTWKSRGLDAVICPVFPTAAPKREIVAKVTVAGSYCQLYNTLNYPAGVVPVTKLNKEDIEAALSPKMFQPKIHMERYLLQDVKTSKGLTASVQVVTAPYQEEKCLRVMNELCLGLQKSVI